MTIWAIVPVKPLNRSKSRLAPVLNPEERAELSREMLIHTLTTLKESRGIGGVLVVSRDTSVLALARQCGANTVQESGSPELNAALTRATKAVMARKASGVLIVASDIPLMRVEDIEDMIALANQPLSVVMATDRREDGTNALLVRPPGLFAYNYGEGSFNHHRIAAEATGADVHFYQSPTLSLDVDIPDDLIFYRQKLRENGLGQHSILFDLKFTPN